MTLNLQTVKVRQGKRKVKVKVWTLAIAPLTWVRLVTSSALQCRKWQLIGMSQWCRSALCGHPLPTLMDNWNHGAASRHTIAPISHTRPSPRSCSYYSFPVLLRVGGWVGLSTQLVSTCSRLLALDRVWVEPATSWLRVQYSTTRPLHPLIGRPISHDSRHFDTRQVAQLLPRQLALQVSDSGRWTLTITLTVTM